MHFVAADTVILDPWQAVAADYRFFAPCRADFTLQAPYQAARKCEGDALTARSSDFEEDGKAVGEAADDSGCAGGSRKRRRASRYQPNEREQEAATRHAEYGPQLAAAAAAARAWLHASSAATLHQALARCGAAQTGTPAAAAAAGAAEAQAARQNHREAAGADGRGGGGSGTAAQGQHPAPLNGCPCEEPSYPAMFEQRHAVRPKLQFAPPRAAGWSQPGWGACGGDTRGGAAQPPAPRNLFDQLIDSSCPANGGCGCDMAAERLAWAGGHPVLLPPRSRFLCSDARRLQPLLGDAAAAGGYHCILLDPPWENKSAKRSARYPTLPSRNLLALPLRGLMHEDGCLVAMWVTNRERHRRFIEQELLPGWGLRQLATWHWLKVTDGGEPVGRLDIEHRRPYESLLLCWPAHLPPPPGSPAQPGPAATGFCVLPGRTLVVVAAPPAAHSRKPHLAPLLLPLLPPGARCLEMFARELHTGWTSWGNEVLKFQGLGYFERRLPAGGGSDSGAGAQALC